MLIIDEAQEMETSIYEGDEQRPCKASISDIIQKQHSLVMISGSNVSMLAHNFLDYSFANRFERQDFTNLEPKDAEKLVVHCCANGYKNLAKDVIELVGENPYYINSLFSYNIRYVKKYKKDKDFSSKDGLLRAYDFEVFHSKGIIYNFWHTHLHKTKEDLNRDPKGKKGLALQLLYKISSNPNIEITYRSLAKEFQTKEDIITRKVKQLENANLIEPTGVALFAHAFPDKVLPVIINRLYHQIIVQGPNKNVAEEAVQAYIKRIKKSERTCDDLELEIGRAEEKLKSIKKRLVGMKINLTSLQKNTEAAMGKVNLKKGVARENSIRKKIRQMVRKKQGWFSDFKLDGDVHSINITGSKGTGCQIDVFARLCNNKKSFALLAEMKDRKTKTGIADARKFVASIKRAKIEYKLKNIVSVYISTSGFSKNAQAYLESFGIQCAYSERVFIE